MKMTFHGAARIIVGSTRANFIYLAPYATIPAISSAYYGYRCV